MSSRICFSAPQLRESLLPPLSALTLTDAEPNKSNNLESACTLSEIYSQNLDKPNPAENKASFFDIRELIEKIEEWIEINSPNLERTENIREKVKTSLFIQSHEYKMAELGLILFYLDQDTSFSFSNDSSLLDFRANQIQNEIETYLFLRDSIHLNPQIASGKTHYLMRCFSKMILTSTQSYNRGGLIAIQLLLNDKNFAISLFLTHEHREHLLMTTKNIFLDRKFDTLFSQPTTLHDDLAFLVAIDLKLSPEKKISSTFVLYAALIALFTDIRQGSRSNCYAVSALIYIKSNHTLKAFKTLLDWLAQGHIEMEGAPPIPIAPLLQKHLFDFSPFDVNFDSNATESLAPHLQLQSIFPIASSENAQIKALMDMSYTRNALVHMELAVLEFINLNRIPEDDLIIEKMYFINTCKKNLFQSGLIPQDIEDFFCSKLSESLWLVPRNEDQIFYTPYSLILDSNDEILFSGDILTLGKVYQNSLLFYKLHDNTLTPLKTISSLQTFIQEILFEPLAHFSDAEQIRSKIDSKDFKDSIALYCQNMIARNSPYFINKEHLRDSDLLLLYQTGGLVTPLLEIAYRAEFESFKTFFVRNPGQLLSNMFGGSPSLFETLRKHPKIFIETTGQHDWILSTLYLEYFFENSQPYVDKLKENIFNPALNKLKKPIPKELVAHILHQIHGFYPHLIQSNIQHYHSIENLTYKGFADLLLSASHPIPNKAVCDILDQKFLFVSVDQNELEFLLKKLGLDLNREHIRFIHQSLPFAYIPSFYAETLRSYLIQQKIHIPDPYIIELELCKLKQIPAPIYIGDLNWGDGKENPTHQHLVMSYSWSHQELRFKTRSSHQDRSDNQISLSQYVFIVPK